MKRLVALCVTASLVAQPVTAQAFDRRDRERNNDTAALVALGAVGVGAALLMQNRDRRGGGRDEDARGGQTDLRDVVRRLQGSRAGRMLGARESAGGRVYVVRWEYPDGRIVDISVDARSGAVIGEN
jgi:hypothetical protein